MKFKKDVVVGYAWYSRAQWALLKAVSADPERLEDTYDEWVAIATASVALLKKTVPNLKKVEIDVEELISWCRANRMAIDGAARSQFTAEKVRQGDKK